MQTQARPPGAASLQPHPALPPSIPRREIQVLITRLTTAVNDIDAFKAHLAAGHQDGSLPNWDSLLSRYAVLLARISSLANSISQLPTPPTLRPGAPKPPSASVPILSKYLVHPLNPLPASLPGAAGASINIHDLFFQGINTMLLPSVSASSTDLLSSENTGGVAPGQPWLSPAELKKMPERDLDALASRLKARMERESGVTERLKDAVKRFEDQYEWGMRIEDDGKGAEGDEDDDLFRDDEGEGEGDKPKVAPSPREGWSLPDYLKFMETGQPPAHLAPPLTQKPDVIDLT